MKLADESKECSLCLDGIRSVASEPGSQSRGEVIPGLLDQMLAAVNFSLGNFRSIVLLAGIVLFLPGSSAAQGGSIRGNVLLPNGSFLNERAKITLQTNRGVRSNVYTDEHGQFQFSGLPPAIYEIIIEPDGDRFEKARATVEVFPNAPAILDINLKEKKPAETKLGSKVVSAGELDPAIPATARKEFERASESTRSEKIDEAVAHLRKAIEIYPGYLMAHNDLGAQLLAQGKLDEAAAEFRRAMEIDPKAFNPRLNLGIVLVQKRQFSEAMSILKTALSLQANSPAAILYDGLAREGANDYEGAERQLTLAHQLGGTQYAKALFHLAQIYVNKGERLRARQLLEEYLREEPRGPDSAEAKRLVRILR